MFLVRLFHETHQIVQIIMEIRNIVKELRKQKQEQANKAFGVRVVTCCPDWAERNERIFEEIRDLLRGSSYEKDYLRKPDYVT